MQPKQNFYSKEKTIFNGTWLEYSLVYSDGFCLILDYTR